MSLHSSTLRAAFLPQMDKIINTKLPLPKIEFSTSVSCPHYAPHSLYLNLWYIQINQLCIAVNVHSSNPPTCPLSFTMSISIPPRYPALPHFSPCCICYPSTIPGLSHPTELNLLWVFSLSCWLSSWSLGKWDNHFPSSSNDYLMTEAKGDDSTNQQRLAPLMSSFQHGGWKRRQVNGHAI